MPSLYCQPSDLLSVGVNAYALQDVDPSAQQAACVTASAMADAWGFRPRYANNQSLDPILIAWGSDVTFMVAKIAVAICLGVRGYSPDAGADDRVQLLWNQAEDYFRGIGRQSITPNVTPNVAVGQNSGADLPQIYSDPRRGYAQLRCGKPVIS
jgi:hypothetical protein